MRTLLIAAALGATMLTATAAVAVTPQTPLTNTQQPVKKAEPKEQHAAKEHHATKGNMKARSSAHVTKAKDEKAATKTEATKEPKKATDKK